MLARGPRPTALALAAALLSSPALAQEEASEPAPTESTVPAAPGTEPEPPWSVTVSAGVAARDDGPDGRWQAVALARTVGRGYLRAGLMRYHGTLQQSDAALPSDYVIGTLGAGGNFGGWVADGWASYGRQVYGDISDSSGTRPSTGAKSSAYAAVGGDFGRVLALGRNWYLTPTVAASFASGRLLRPAPAGSGLTDRETDEPTWSGNAAIRLDRVFGAAGQHFAGLSLSRNATSNGVSALRLRPLDPSDPGAGFTLDSKHYADGWFEVSASASMALADRLHVDLTASRSFGVLAGNLTSAGLSLRRSF